MKTFKSCLFIAILACAIGNAWSQAPESAPRSATAIAATRNYNEATQETGTIIKKNIRWTSKIPLDKNYHQLTEEQKAELHAFYEKLAPGDEPPFPVEGMKAIFNPIKKAQSLLQARGQLNMAVTVGPDGKAIKVEDFGGVHNGQMIEIAQQVLLLTRYKPAVCSGAPCAMQFPFVLKLKGG